MEYKAYALMAILLASVASVGTIGAAFAQASLATDSTEYSTGDFITVTGNVGVTPTGQPAVIRVFSPTNNIVHFGQFNPAANGSFSYEFRAGGVMNTSGEYRVVVTYGGVDIGTATFDFTSTEEGRRNATLVIDGQFRHTIQYQITGGTLRSLTGDSETASVTATITANNNGQLTLYFPRNVFDATANGGDIDFVVFVDELETIPEDDFGADVRAVTIDFEAGSEQVDIIGTFLVPEFGTIAAIVLAVAIVGIIVATTRYSKFSFLPKM